MTAALFTAIAIILYLAHVIDVREREIRRLKREVAGLNRVIESLQAARDKFHGEERGRLHVGKDGFWHEKWRAK